MRRVGLGATRQTTCINVECERTDKRFTSVHGPRWRMLIVGGSEIAHYLAIDPAQFQKTKRVDWIPESAMPSHRNGWTSGLEHLDETCQKGLLG